jgi:dethiobiotin synthase
VNGPRPGKLVVVVGTTTDIGKTWVSAALVAGCLGSGMRVAARKPAQSFEPGAGPTDAEVLAAASAEDPEWVCPPQRWYEVPFAPPMAAEHLGRPAILLAELVEEISWPDPAADLGLVELAGGVESPIASDREPIELVREIGPDHLILVADAGLGTINAVRLSVRFLRSALRVPVLVVLNRFDDTDELHRLNAAWLEKLGDLEIVLSRSGQGAAVAEALRSRIWPR